MKTKNTKAPQPFDFLEYREYLREALPVTGPNRGGRTKLAEALGCQAGFISLALSGGADFSLEHGIRIARFLALTEEEEDFLLLLIDYGRAGSEDLRRHFRKKIEAIRSKRSEIRGRIQPKETLPEADQILYYSTWIYTAVHMAVMVPELQERKAIGRFLHLPLERVDEALGFLIRTGLAVEKGGRIQGGATRIHLPSSSPLIAKHHANWRLRALHSLERSGREDLHYSLIMSLSKEAAGKIKSILLDCVQTVEPVLKKAKDETLFALNLDLFSLDET